MCDSLSQNMEDALGIRSILDCRRVGLETGVSWDDYRQFAAMNPSTLVIGLSSMRRLRWSWDHPSAPTAAQQLGSAVHTLCLEPREFERRYAHWEGSRRTKEYREFAVDAWEQRKRVLTDEEWFTAQQIALSVVAHDGVRGLIKSGQAEVSVFTSELGIQCKGRIDWIAGEGAERQAIVDLKTASNVSSHARGRAFFQYSYDIKLGLYQRWVEKVTGVLYPVIVIWVETVPPYDVVLDDSQVVLEPVLANGVRKGLELFTRLRECLDTDQWPGPAGPMEVPYYAMSDELMEFHDED